MTDSPWLGSLWIVLGTTILSLLMGTFCALGWSLLPRPATRVLRVLSLLPLIYPKILLASVWLDAMGRHPGLMSWLPWDPLSSPAAILVLSASFWPWVALLVDTGWNRIPDAVCESDTLLVNGRIWRWVLWEHLKLPALLGGVLVAGLASTQFVVPVLFQVNVVPAELWSRMNLGVLDFRESLISLLGLAAFPLLGWWLVARKSFRNWLSPDTREWVATGLWTTRCRGAWRLVPIGILALWMGWSVIWPIVSLLLQTEAWADLGNTFAANGQAGWGTLWSSFLIAILACLVSRGVIHTRWQGLWIVGFLFPAVLAGEAVLAARYPGVATVADSLFPWMALSVWRLGLPAWLVVLAWQAAVPSDHQEAAHWLGAGRWARWRHLEWPSIRPAALPILCLLACLAAWDAETAVVLAPPGLELLAPRIFNMLHYGHDRAVASVLLLLMAPLLLPFLLGCFSWLRSFRSGYRTILCLAGIGLSALAGGCLPESSSHPGEASKGPLPLPENVLFERVETFVGPGQGVGALRKPRTLEVDAQGRLFVVDLTGKVQCFRADGSFSHFWQIQELERGKPKGMGWDLDGSLLLVEPHYGRVERYSPEGLLLETLKVEPMVEGYPRALARDILRLENHYLVAEYGGREGLLWMDRVEEEWKPGKLWGGSGREPGQFNRPEGLALDGEGRIWVADSCNHRVQVLQPDGSVDRILGKAGTGPGELSYPYDVCMDPLEDLIWVCEFGNSRIQAFDPDGRSIMILASAGKAPGQLMNPWSIAMNSAGDLFAADAMNHRIQKWVRRRDP